MKDVVYLIIFVLLVSHKSCCYFQPVAFWHGEHSCKVEFLAKRSDNVLLVA